MRTLVATLLIASGEAMAHSGHGGLGVHLHWWEYGLLAALLAGLLVWAKKK